jgi:hypothetical protein
MQQLFHGCLGVGLCQLRLRQQQSLLQVLRRNYLRDTQGGASLRRAFQLPWQLVSLAWLA